MLAQIWCSKKGLHVNKRKTHLIKHRRAISIRIREIILFYLSKFNDFCRICLILSNFAKVAFNKVPNKGKNLQQVNWKYIEMLHNRINLKQSQQNCTNMHNENTENCKNCVDKPQILKRLDNYFRKLLFQMLISHTTINVNNFKESQNNNEIVKISFQFLYKLSLL